MHTPMQMKYAIVVAHQRRAGREKAFPLLGIACADLFMVCAGFLQSNKKFILFISCIDYILLFLLNSP